MKRRLLKLFAALILALPLAAAGAAERVELIQLQYRNAEELLPLLRPQFDDQVRLSGQAGNLLVRAEPEALARVRELVRQLDTAPRSLRISVQRDARAASEGRGYRGSGEVRVGDGGRARGRVEVYSSESASSDGRTASVRALEGRPAWIGESVILPLRERTAVIGGRGRAAYAEQLRYVELRDGFYARARVQGGRVEVDLMAQAAEPAGRGRIAGEQVITTVSGRLGEWLEVGAIAESAEDQGRGIVYRSESASEQRSRIQLKVELLGRH